MRSRIDTAFLLARTTRNLRPAQLVHRARLRAQRFPPSRPLAASVLRLLPAVHRPVTGWPAGFMPVDLQLAEGCPTPEDNADGRFTFLNQGVYLQQPVRWAPPDVSRLWTYHLHYMEWAWSFAAHPDRAWARMAFADLWQSWQESTPFGRGDQWSPYVASLRAWVLCGVYRPLVAGGDVTEQVTLSLGRHAQFLRWHVEHDVGGNHLVKNLKALIGLAVFLDDDRLWGAAIKELQRQLRVQVLGDGGHYERSPSYHCQVLGDLIDIEELLAAAGAPAVRGLSGAIDRMRTWLGVMLLPDGDVPVFNDCVLVGRRRLALLRPGPAPSDRLTVLAASGYAVVRPDPRVHLVADVGDPCPPDLPAHAQADCLSFELAVDGERVVVDAGTSTYAPGAQRAYERSTPAHNTVAVDGMDQTEVWATFRAARLARAQLERTADDGRAVTVTASHGGYRRLPGSPVHRRTWEVSPERITITDEVLGEGNHRVESHLRFASQGGRKVVWASPPDVRVAEGPARYATGFGTFQDGHLVSATWRGDLPVTMRMELPLTPTPEGQPGKGTT